MAEFAMRHLADSAGAGERFYVESAAVSSEEIGNPVYPPARKILAQNGISCGGKRARKTEPSDYEKVDLIVCMDSDNLRRARAIYGGDPLGKIRLLLEFANSKKTDVADPWYTGDFSETWSDVLAGCGGILKRHLGAEPPAKAS